MSARHDFNITLHDITLHYITLHCIALRYVTLRYITLHLHCIIINNYITLHYITLHCITLHYITLQHNILVQLTIHYFDKTVHHQHITSTIHYVNNMLRKVVVATLSEVVVMVRNAVNFRMWCVWRVSWEVVCSAGVDVVTECSERVRSAERV